MSAITEQDVRDECVDRFPSDHDLHPDILFSKEDIESAMRHVARTYNGMQPQVENVNPSCLPGCDNVFLDGIVAVLYRRMRNNKALNEMVYSAGGVSSNTDTVLKNNLEKLADEYDNRFREAAIQRKVARNLRSAYGQIG